MNGFLTMKNGILCQTSARSPFKNPPKRFLKEELKITFTAAALDTKIFNYDFQAFWPLSLVSLLTSLLTRQGQDSEFPKKNSRRQMRKVSLSFDFDIVCCPSTSLHYFILLSYQLLSRRLVGVKYNFGPSLPNVGSALK